MSQQFNSESTVAQVRGYLVGLQARIIGALEAVEAQAAAAEGDAEEAVRALVDPWRKEPGTPLQGDGSTQIIEGGRVLSAPAAASRTCAGRNCRPRRRSTAPSWLARRSRQWACRWSFTRAILTCLRYT